MYTNDIMPESACAQSSMCSYTLNGNDGSVVSVVKWVVDLLWYMHNY